MNGPHRRPRAIAAAVMTFALLAMLTAPPAHARAGAIDPSFGDDGLVTTRLGWGSRAFSVALQPDGKIVAGGYVWPSEDSPMRWGLARYLPNGRLDPAFGRRGVVVTDVGTAHAIRHVLVQRDGGIVAVGGDFALRRYFPNGRPDHGFARGFDGIPRSGVSAAVLQRDGKIVLVGALGRGVTADLMVARFRADGTPDQTFGDGGVFVLPAPGVFNVATDVALAPDGGIIVAGWSSDAVALAAAMTVWRLTPEGELDFEVNPVRAWPRQVTDGGYSWFVDALVVRPDGRILVGGDETHPLFPFRGDFATAFLVQMLPDGRLDPAFGADGVAHPFGRRSTAEEVKDLVLQPNGDALIVGTRYPYAPGWRGLVARVRPDGSLDDRFGDGGMVVTPTSRRSTASWWAGALAPDGKAVVAGLYRFPQEDSFRFALMRFLSD